MTGTSDLPAGQVCLYHDKKWRSRFHHLVNLVRVEIIPVQYLACFQSLVCVCKPGKRERNLTNFKQALQEFDCKEIPNKAVSEIMEDIFKSELWNVDQHRCKSVKMLVYLLYCALKGDFRVMMKESPKTPVPNLMTKLKIEVETKDFCSSYIGLMIGKKGKNIDVIQKKYNCKIILRAGSTEKFSAEVKYPVNKPGTLKDVSECLEKTAKRIVYERQLHAQRFELYIKRKLERALTRPRLPTSNVNICDMKDANTRMFTRRRKANRKFCVKQQHISKLEGSHCLNCLTNYTTSLFKDTRCKHHPGYKVRVISHDVGKRKKKSMKYRWTCCDLECDKSDALSKDHTDSGCTVAMHNWRPERRQQKGEAKPKVKVFSPHMN